MPTIAGVNILGVLVAAIAMYVIGFLWYGVLFSDLWMSAAGYTEADFEGQSGSWMAAGFVIPLLLSFGLGWHMRQKHISKMGTAALFGLWMALLIGVPLMLYAYIYSPQHSWELLLIDSSHILATFVAGCVVLSLFDHGKAAAE